MILTIIFIIIWATLYALVGGIALKIAYRLFFREYSMEYADAFKLMFIAGLFAFGSNVVFSIAGVEGEVLAMVLPTVVNFLVVTLVLLQWEGLTPGQALGVGGLTSIFFFLLLLGISMAIAGAYAA